MNIPQINLRPLKTKKGFLRPPASSRLEIGDEAPYFSLLGTDKRIYSLSDFSKAECLAVIFVGNRCYHTKRISVPLIRIQRLYKHLGFQIVAICSNDGNSYPENSFKEMTRTSKIFNYPFPYLHDETQEVAASYDAACTPEVFLFDKKLKLRYHGQPDLSTKKRNLMRGSAFLRAIDAVLSTQNVDVKYTSCVGSSIKWRSQ